METERWKRGHFREIRMWKRVEVRWAIKINCQLISSFSLPNLALYPTIIITGYLINLSAVCHMGSKMNYSPQPQNFVES